MKNKILICGAGLERTAHLTKLVEQLHAHVELITPEQATEQGIEMSQFRQPIPLEPPPIVDFPFYPPMTRAQRRANERKSKKLSKNKFW